MALKVFNLLFFLLFLDVEEFYTQLDAEISRQLFKAGTGNYVCNFCDSYETPTKATMVKHMEAKHFPGPGISCRLCQKHLATRHSYRMHLARNHNEMPVSKFCK